MWGRPEIEGGVLGQKYEIKLHEVEKHHAGIGDVISHQLIDSSRSRSMDENASCYSDRQMIQSLNEGLCHFVPMLHKTPAPYKTIYIYIIYISQIRYWNLFELNVKSVNVTQYGTEIRLHSTILS
jgi:hypothetical protein